MNSNTPPDKIISTQGLREVYEHNGHHFYRRKGTERWIEYFPAEKLNARTPSSPADPPLFISLIMEDQIQSEFMHWSLFVHQDGNPGSVYQVKGDAECMSYRPSIKPINILCSASFRSIYDLAPISEEQAATVAQIAASEPPPKATSRATVTENCQGWVVRVISRLVEARIVPLEKLEMAKSMLQPILNTFM